MSLIKYLAALALLMGSTNVLAEDDDESYVGFDSLVSELTAKAQDPVPVDSSDWEDVALHAGVGIVTSYISIRSPEGEAGAGIMKGIEAHFGANLFSKRLRAEVLFRNYAAESLTSSLTADLKEFELRAVYLPYLRDRMRMRIGAGFSARYMDVDTRTATVSADHSRSTPSASFLLGFERKITSSVAIGPDLTYRSAIVSETYDKSAWDASLNLNATF